MAYKDPEKRKAYYQNNKHKWHLYRNQAVRSAQRNSGLFCWLSMNGRCYNPKNVSYHNYGGKGVGVADYWRYGENGLSGFEVLTSPYPVGIGPRPSEKHTLSRFGDVGNYERGNVEWSDKNVRPRTEQHGTRAMYGSGCRCDACVKANREYSRRYRVNNSLSDSQREAQREYKRWRRANRSEAQKEADREYNRQWRATHKKS